MIRTTGISCILCVCIAVAQATEQTEVRVAAGKVEVVSDSGASTVAAGQKALVRPGIAPVASIDDPAVRDLLVLHKWAKADSERAQVRVDGISVQSLSFDSVNAVTAAAVVEMPNKERSASNVCSVGPMTNAQLIRFHDMQGAPLSFTLDEKENAMAAYHVQLGAPVAAGGRFQFILVAQTDAPAEVLRKEGAIWTAFNANDSRYYLNYFQVTLPESAVLVNWTRPLQAVESRGGRTTVLVRNYTGEEGDGALRLRFLWPAKDGTTLADIPAEYLPGKASM
jgi:hypothetical protein